MARDERCSARCRTTDDAAKLIAERAREIEEELAELVEINSFTDNTEGGRKVGEMLVARTFLVPQLDYRVVPSKRYAIHRVFSSRGDASRRPIALVGHLDTVFPPGTFEGFKRDGDLARGPGVLDMKGGLVVVAYALRALAETVGLDAIAPIRLVDRRRRRGGLAGRAGRDPRRHRRREGRARLRGGSQRRRHHHAPKGDGIDERRRHGRAAHAGNNHKEGANAIWAIARFVDAAQELTDYDARRHA